ncbi:MAG: phosphoethanolamine transferase CptA [Methylotenera sp.]|nr:phosphoethanolamine transferase CptA [Methylotenera sp.]
MNTTNPKASIWPHVAWTFLLFWYLTSTTQLLLSTSGITSFEGLKDTTLTTAFWLIPIFLLPKHTKKVSAILGGTIWLFALPAFGYFLIYKQELSQSLIFIIFESNNAESSEYLRNYFTFSILFKFIIFSIIPILIWRKIPLNLNISKKKGYIFALIILVLFFAHPIRKAMIAGKTSVAYKNLNKHLVSAPPWQLILGYSNYQRELKEVESFLMKFNQSAPLDNFAELKKPSSTTVVIVIGESSTRLHFGLYGYHRDTNPKLSTMKDELSIFKNVYASRPNTIESLEQILSFADQSHPDLYKTKPTLIAMMKQAGYKTFWISNQQTLTARNTILTTFAKQTDKQIWLNNARSQNSYSFDEKVLEPFSETLKDNAEKKLIIVHLIGTHMSYKYRYPKSFDYFKDSKNLYAGLSEDKIQKINEYDNAVRYNDSIVYDLIQRLKSTNQHSMLTFFSDHGDDVFDSKGHEFQGRNEYSPTLPMYAVPFITWSSKDWFTNDLLKNPAILDRQYSNADFIYTWSQLMGITYKGFDQTKSIVSDQFKNYPIIVGNPYDAKSLKKLEIN